MENTLADAIFITGLLVFMSTCISTIKYISRAKPNPTQELAKCAGYCFIAGTLVECKDGTKKKIEDVKIGDKVLAYNEKTGEQAYKTVLHLYRNESKDWVGVTVEDKEIVSTPRHKYYLPLTKQWVSATDIKADDTVLLSNGQYSKVLATRSIHYDTPQTTYNFEVEDFHTYYVGDGVLVHNQDCILEELGVKDFSEVGKRYAPNQLIEKLDDLGFTKEISFRSKKSGPAVIMKKK